MAIAYHHDFDGLGAVRFIYGRVYQLHVIKVFSNSACAFSNEYNDLFQP